jgi:hypothetical protein
MAMAGGGRRSRRRRGEERKGLLGWNGEIWEVWRGM